MAKCPKCEMKLKITDWKPNCPHCGINILFYNNEDRLLDEAEFAEAEHAKFRKRIDNLKASYYKTKIVLARTILSVIAFFSVCIPLAKLTGPGVVKYVNVIAMYNYIDTAGTGKLIDGLTNFNPFSVSFIAILLSVILVLLGLIFNSMSCGKFGKVRDIFFNILTISTATLSVVKFLEFATKVNTYFEAYTDGTLFFGIYFYFALIIAIFVINIVLCVKGIEVEYTECLIGGIPEKEYFALKESGISKEEMHKRMKEAIAAIEKENEIRAAEHNKQFIKSE